MGLVKKLLGGTLAFLGSIFGFLGGLLGLGKKSEYFREFEEAIESAAVTLPAAQPAKAAAASAPAKPAPAPTAQAVASAQPAKAEEAKPAAAPATAKAEPPAPKPKVQVASIQNGKVEQLSESAPAAIPAAVVEHLDEQTFAPKYLIGMSTNGRRRPGPSLNYFRDMAKQVKTN